jgi:peptidoglycan hydrolase CwlO-like protein
MNYQENVAELEAQQTQLTEQIEFAKTLELRERIHKLESELRADIEILKSARVQSRETDAFVIPKVRELQAEIKKLNEQAFSDLNKVYNLDDGTRKKRSEIYALERELKATNKFV